MREYTSYMVIPASDELALERANKSAQSCKVKMCWEQAPCPVHDVHGGVTQEQALAVLDEIASKYQVDYPLGADLFLTSHEHEDLDPGRWAIAWEGGPEEWSFHRTSVPGVYCEAGYSWLIYLYPAGL